MELSSFQEKNQTKKEKEKKMKKTIVITVCVVALSFMEALAIMFGWNWIIAKGFGVREIGYWLAFGISSILTLLQTKIGESSRTKDVDEIIAMSITSLAFQGFMIGVFALVSLGI